MPQKGTWQLPVYVQSYRIFESTQIEPDCTCNQQTTVFIGLKERANRSRSVLAFFLQFCHRRSVLKKMNRVLLPLTYVVQTISFCLAHKHRDTGIVG
jgi:hypothetical protein